MAIHDGTIVINAAQGDGIQSNNDEDPEKGWISLDGGTLDITAGKDGIKAETVLQVTGGNIHVTAGDDGLNTSGGNGSAVPGGRPGENNPTGKNRTAESSSAFIRITNGYVVVNATGDGLDANGALNVDGGTILVNGPTANNNGPIDYDGVAEISGGTLVAAGSSGMAQNFSASSGQNSLLVAYSYVQKAGTLVTLLDEGGKTILSFAPARDYQSIVLSTDKLAQGKTYILYSSGSSSGKNTDGLYSEGNYTPGTKVVSVTLSGPATCISDTGAEITRTGGPGMGGPGRGGAGRGGPGPGKPDIAGPGMGGKGMGGPGMGGAEETPLKAR